MTTGQIKQTEVDPIAEAPVERASTAQPLPRWIWLCLAAGVLVLAYCHLFRHPCPRHRGIESGSGDRRILAPDGRGGSPNPERLGGAGDRAARQRHGIHRHPLYARTSGYLKAWYADIGARVKQGQLLAIISSPEVDQQLHAGARGCCHGADQCRPGPEPMPPATRDCCSQNAVTQQDTDTFVSQAQATVPRSKRPRPMSGGSKRCNPLKRSMLRLTESSPPVTRYRRFGRRRRKTPQPRSSSISPPYASCGSMYPCPKPIHNPCGRAPWRHLPSMNFPGRSSTE